MPSVPSGNAYLGVDPGKSGGLALRVDSTTILDKMPETPADVLSWIRFHCLRATFHCVACLEQVGGYTGEGQPGSAMFNFGRGFGHLEMALLACNIPTTLVHPRTWQKAMGISPRKKTETKTQWKNRIKATAQRLFPRSHVTLATADALLIAEYCRRKHEGKL